MTSHSSSGGLYHRLQQADETYGKLPMNMKLQLEKISQALAEFGPRKLRRAGPGTEFFGVRPYREGDERRAISARETAKRPDGTPMVIEKQAEIRQHFYLWRDGSAGMDWRSDDSLPTKKDVAEVMLLALAKHLARNEETVGIIDQKGMYRGGKVSERLAEQLNQVSVITGDVPAIGRKFPPNSTAVLFSDFWNIESVKTALANMSGSGLKGYLVMVADPAELGFHNMKGRVELIDPRGGPSVILENAEKSRNEWQQRMEKHIAEVEKLAKAKGFKLILQRTDRDPAEGLLGIYGLSANAPTKASAPGR